MWWKLEDVLKMALGTKVKIKPGKKKSKIEIEFYSADDLERLVEVLTNPKTVTNKFKGNSNSFNVSRETGRLRCKIHLKENDYTLRFWKT